MHIIYCILIGKQLARFQKDVPYEDVGFFVATQNLDLINRLKEGYGVHKVKSFNGTITTTFEPNQEGQMVSLITWWLLGECDEVVTTEASSYGLTGTSYRMLFSKDVAAARTGLFPIVCNHNKFCLRRLSQTPCQDTPFVHEQPPDCLLHNRTRLHQFMTSPENSCGYFKWQIYTSPEFHNDKWNIKGLS